MNKLIIEKLKYKANENTFTNNVVHIDYPYTYDDNPCVIGEYVSDTAFKMAVIVLSKNLGKVDNIYILHEGLEKIENILGVSLKFSSKELFPRVLFNGYFASDSSDEDYHLPAEFAVDPIYLHEEYVIYQHLNKLKIGDKSKIKFIYQDLSQLPLLDVVETKIIESLVNSNVSIVPYDICRMLNSYRRLKLNINNDEINYWVGYEDE